MSQILSNAALHPKVSESLPGALNYGSIPPANSVIVDRKTVRETPMSGSVFGTTSAALKQMQFRLNSPNLIDPETVRLNFYHRCYGAGKAAVSANARVRCDDFIQSIIDSVVIKIGSQEAERIDDYAVLANALSYYSMPQEYYDRQASVNEGAYMYSTSATSADAAMAAASAGAWYSIPIHVGLFRQNKLLPPNMDITVELNLDSFAKSHIVSSTDGNVVQSPYAEYELLECKLTMDEVSVFSSWYGHYDKAIQSDSGISLPIETYELVPAVVTQPNSSFLISRGVKDLRTILSVWRRSSQLADVTNSSKAQFQRANVRGYQYKLAGKSYPVDYTDNYAQMFTEIQKGFAQLGSIDSGGVIQRTRFTGVDGAAGASLFAIAQNFQNSNESPFSGANTLTQGYAVTFAFQQRDANSSLPQDQGAYAADNPSSANSYQVNNYLHSMKIIDLRSSRLFITQ